MYGIYDDNTILLAKFTVPMMVRSNQPVFASDSFSLKRYATKRTSQRWEIEAGLEPLQDSNDLITLFTVKGYDATIKVAVPQNYGSILNNKSTSTVTVTGTVDVTTLTLVAKPNGLIKKGTYFTIAGHSKVYMTTTDSTAGSTTVGIFPKLRTACTAAAITYGASSASLCMMNAYVDLDTALGMSYSDGILMGIENIKLVEAL